MPEITGYADLFRDWEGLIGACEQNEGILPDVAPFKDDLTAVMQEAKAMKLHQENLEGNRRAATQKLKEIIERGRESKRKLQGFVKIRLGSKSEHLLQFGIAPIRRRNRRAPTVKPPEEGGPQTKAEAPKPGE